MTESEESNLETFEDYQRDQEDLETVARNVEDLTIDDWVLVKFMGKKTIKHYIGQVKNIENGEVSVNFTRKSNFLNKTSIFIFPTVTDCWPVPEQDIISVLPKPQISRRGEISFAVSFAMYNMA